MRSDVRSYSAEILLLSDRDHDVALIRSVVGSAKINVVSGCKAVMSYLRREQPYSESARPDLILLDLDLSNPEHCELLRGIKEDPELGRIPLVVFASDTSHSSVVQAYSLNANAYVIKPQDQDEYLRVIRTTLNFWLTLARLPRD